MGAGGSGVSTKWKSLRDDARIEGSAGRRTPGSRDSYLVITVFRRAELAGVVAGSLGSLGFCGPLVLGVCRWRRQPRQEQRWSRRFYSRWDQ